MKKKIRVLRLLPVLDYGGVESRAVSLGKFINLDRFEYRVCALSRAGNAGQALRAIGVEVDELGQETNPRVLGTYEALRGYIRGLRPHIVHSSISDSNVRAAWVRLVDRSFRLIIEEVGVDPERSLRARAAQGIAAGIADSVIGVSRQTCEWLIERHWVSRKKVIFINNSMDSRFLEISERNPADGLRCLAVGRLVPEKNHGMLIDAFSLLQKSYPGASLDIVGEGPLRADLETRINRLRVSDSVRLRGKQADVAGFLQKSDVFLMPSTTEGTSIALSEAMASASPLIGSRVPGIVDAVQDYGDEWLLSPQDPKAWAAAIEKFGRLVKRERVLLGRRARQIVLKRMSPVLYANALMDVYEGILDAGAMREC